MKAYTEVANKPHLSCATRKHTSLVDHSKLLIPQPMGRLVIAVVMLSVPSHECHGTNTFSTISVAHAAHREVHTFVAKGKPGYD